VFSLEMSSLQLVNRLISNVCSLESTKIRNGQLNQPEWENLMTRTRSLSTAPLYIDDTPSLSIFELRTKARRLVREQGVKIIIIDYLQLMNATGMKFGSREQEVSTISRNLKQLAKELDIPIIALSQLNRSVETRSVDDKMGKRPQLSDLRESGAIEQDADIVCFIHRPEKYTKSAVDAEGNNIKGLAEFIVAKHRSGATKDINLHFVEQYARFENQEDSFNLTGETTYESKMNATAPDTGASPANDGMTPPPPNVDFLPGPEEQPTPF
jgi:replicative DNA helicase